MSKFEYYFFLTMIEIFVLALLGAAVGYAVIRPVSNSPDRIFTFSQDMDRSMICLFFAALVSYFGSLFMGYYNYDD